MDWKGWDYVTLLPEFTGFLRKGSVMGRILRFLNGTTRTASRAIRSKKQVLGHSPDNRRLVCEALEVRTLLSASLQVFPDWHVAPDSGSHGSASPSALDPTPNQIRAAYGLGTYTGGVLSGGISFAGTPGDGRGQTIAIVDAYDYPTALSDLNTFSSYYGLPTFGGAGHPTFETLNQYGNTSPLPSTDPAGPAYVTGGSDWEGEEALDIEYAHAIAPMANIILFEANDDSGNLDNLFTAVQSAANTPGVVAVSMSWGMDESGPYGLTAAEVSEDDITCFNTPSGHLGGSATLGGTDLPGGVTFLTSAGDNGAYSNDAPTSVTPEYPATPPNVIAVGGTALNVSGSSNSNYAWGSETAWGDGVNSGINGNSGVGEFGGGGGGISSFESQPAYQKGVVNAFSTTRRTYPDVSAEASPGSDTFPDQGVSVYDYYDGGDPTDAWSPGVGGTSLSSPMWAGIIAIADEGRALAGQGSLDGPSQTLPELYKLPAADFHDITSGSTGPSPEFAARSGYDLASGLGSPVGNLLIPGLVAYQPVVTSISPATGPTAGNTVVTITGTDLSGVTVVDFGSTPATNVTVNAAGTEITATSPSGTGVVDVTVIGPGGTSTISSADKFTYVQGPAVTGVSPALGPGRRHDGDDHGAGLHGATAVHFGSVSAPVSRSSRRRRSRPRAPRGPAWST